MNNDEVIRVLNNLIETCRDGQEGFKEAADNVKSPDLKSFFNEASQQRARFVRELQDQVRALSGDPDKAGSVAGALHRTWMNIKGTLTGKDDEKILSECERGEDSAVEAYEEALAKPLPATVKAIVQRQYLEVKKTHDRVKKLRDTRSATAGRK